MTRAKTHYYYAALLPRRGPHIASHSVCLSVCPSVPLSSVVAPPSELQWHTCTFRHALRAAYRTAISVAQILVIIINNELIKVKLSCQRHCRGTCITFGVIRVAFRCRPLATAGKVSAAESPIENAIISDRRWRLFKGHVSRCSPIEEKWWMPRTTKTESVIYSSTKHFKKDVEKSDVSCSTHPNDRNTYLRQAGYIFINICFAQYNLSVQSSQNVESKRQSVDSKMGKWGVLTVGTLTVLHLKWWLTHIGDFHFQFCVVLKYEIIDVFCVKNTPLSLKMSSASGDFVPRPPTMALPQEPMQNWRTSVPRPLFFGVQKILKLYYACLLAALCNNY